jgi:hypothetical protein
MGHRLDIASGKNEFDRRLGNFRVQIKLDDEGEQVAAITASILAPRHLSEHQRSSGIPSTVDIPRWTFRRPRQMHCGWLFLF